jgi:MFS family permease
MGQLEKRFPRYGKLLNLYPFPYRQHYRSEILQTLADMLDNAPTAKARRAIWLRVALDLPLSISKENLMFIGGVMTQETPNYVKLVTTVGSALVLPFFVIVIAASINHNLHTSFLWHPNVLLTWLVILPGIAFLLAMFVLFGWLQQRKKSNHKSLFKELFDLRRNWLLLAVIVLSFGIVTLAFGHDTGHCINGNPLREVRNAQGVWSCIQKS